MSSVNGPTSQPPSNSVFVLYVVSLILAIVVTIIALIILSGRANDSHFRRIEDRLDRIEMMEYRRQQLGHNKKQPPPPPPPPVKKSACQSQYAQPNFEKWVRVVIIDDVVNAVWLDNEGNRHEECMSYSRFKDFTPDDHECDVASQHNE